MIVWRKRSRKEKEEGRRERDEGKRESMTSNPNRGP